MLFGQKPALTGAGLEPLLPQDSRTFQILAAGTTHELTRVGVVEASGPAATLGGNVLIMDCDLAGASWNNRAKFLAWMWPWNPTPTASRLWRRYRTLLRV